MPADIKTHPATNRPTSLQGSVYSFATPQDRVEAIDQAFDYRGDVTLTVKGETVEGYMFNRNAKAQPPVVHMFLKGSETPTVIPYSDIMTIAFTGKDTADGKSWDAWVSKKEGERAAEAERIRAEAEAQGHL